MYPSLYDNEAVGRLNGSEVLVMCSSVNHGGGGCDQVRTCTG